MEREHLESRKGFDTFPYFALLCALSSSRPWLGFCIFYYDFFVAVPYKEIKREIPNNRKGVEGVRNTER